MGVSVADVCKLNDDLYAFERIDRTTPCDDNIVDFVNWLNFEARLASLRFQKNHRQ